jgi:hypothetical protein
MFLLLSEVITSLRLSGRVADVFGWHRSHLGYVHPSCYSAFDNAFLSLMAHPEDDARSSYYRTLVPASDKDASKIQVSLFDHISSTDHEIGL